MDRLGSRWILDMDKLYVQDEHMAYINCVFSWTHGINKLCVQVKHIV